MLFRSTYMHAVEKERTDYVEMLERLGYTKIEETEMQAIMRKDLT